MIPSLFKYNPTPWTHARCGDNWDINLPSNPDDTGVGVVATVFGGEDIARLIAAAPELHEALSEMVGLYGTCPELEECAACSKAIAALAKARAEA